MLAHRLCLPRPAGWRGKGALMESFANAQSMAVEGAPWADLLARLNRDKPDQARIRHDATIPFGPAMRVERFALGNGLQLLVLVDTAAPIASVHTWFGVGSRHERIHKTGISHLFEHL